MTSARLSDNQAGIEALERLKGKVPRLQRIIGDHAYKTTFIEHSDKKYGWKVEIAPHRKSPNRLKFFCPKRTAGRSKDHSDGLILGADWQKIMKKP